MYIPHLLSTTSSKFVENRSTPEKKYFKKVLLSIRHSFLNSNLVEKVDFQGSRVGHKLDFFKDKQSKRKPQNNSILTQLRTILEKDL